MKESKKVKPSEKQNKKATGTNSTLTNKKALLCMGAAVAVILIIGGVIFFAPSKKFTVAFYNIAEKQRQGITSVIDKIAEKNNISVLYVDYNSEKSLKDELPLTKKPNIVITTSGFALESAIDKASKSAALSAEVSQGMTSSMRSAIRQDGDKITAFPILSSHFEADVDLVEFQNSNTKYINTWNDVEKFMREQKRKKESPMIFAGGNPDTFLDLIGAMAESIDGAESYTAAAKIIKENTNPVRAAIKLCDEPDSPLATSVKQLKAWYKLGFIHPGTFSMQQNDVEAFASSRLSSVLFMSLENHREVAQKTISRYTSIYFPSEHGANSRIFTGKTYYAIPLVKSAKNEKILGELISAENQETLSRSTGLAPVLAQCRIPDKQADDARYWIAATAAPLPGLSNETFLTKQQKTAIAAEIASRIKN